MLFRSGWYGVIAPAKLPKPILDRLHGALVKVLQTPDIRDRILSEGAEPVGNTPEQFGALIRAEIDKWGKVIRAAGLRAD